MLGGVLLLAGCGRDGGGALPNQSPNTRISAGPPEEKDTGFVVDLFWFGWDEDGFVDHYEIAWEKPEDWEPVFTSDSTFTVQAAESCCVEPIPDFPPDLHDSVYEQFHTFYVRAVDNLGEPDPTPAYRSFNAKTVAPYTEIDFGPKVAGLWGTDVQFKWTGKDDDGVVVAYRAALVQETEFEADMGRPPENLTEMIGWLDTLTYHPDPAGGGYTDSLVWQWVEQDSILYPGMPATTGSSNLYLFAVRATDDAGAEERILDPGTNTRQFNVTEVLNGPLITLTSNILGLWRSGDLPSVREAFAGQGIRFEWSATPGQSEAEVAGYSYAIDDTAEWSPLSIHTTQFPEQIPGEDEILWFPRSGPHTFFVRAVDLGGFERILAARLEILNGPRFCPEEDRRILVVLDADPGSLIDSRIWPDAYKEVERALIDYYFEGYNHEVFETTRRAPPVSLLNCATSTFWFHSASVQDGDGSELEKFHTNPPNVLPSYVSSGGNLFLCGIQPANAVKYFEKKEGNPQLQHYPIDFESSLSDTTVLPHWFATHFGIAKIEESIGNTVSGSSASKRLYDIVSAVRTGANPYPDLVFDPLTWPSGPVQHGFGYYDRGIVPIDPEEIFPPTEVIYTRNDTDVAVGVRRLSGPGINGNLVYLGFHPYFVDRPAFRELIRAVLTDFGEMPNP